MLFGPANTIIVTARQQSSLVSTNVPLWSSIKLFLILGVILGKYPQAVSACPAHTAEAPRGDVWQSQRTHAHSLNLELQPEQAQLLIMQRDELNGNETGKLVRRDPPANVLSLLNSLLGDSFGGGNHQATTTSTPRIAVTTSTTRTTPAAQTTSTPIITTTPPPAPAILVGTTGSSQSTSAPSGTNNQPSGGSQEATGTQPSGNGANTTQPSPTTLRPSLTGQAAPNQSHNDSYNDPGSTMTLSVGAGGNYQSGNGINKGLLVGLVVSLIILVALCAFAAFFMVRRIRRNRRRQQASPYSDTAPCIVSSKTGLTEAYNTEKAESGDPWTSPRESITSEPRLRARTPGGSSAIPVPYNPSEVSDDASSHFTFLSRDDAIGVPVPYPLALHVPARVANAMAERDARWKQGDDLQRHAYLHDRSSSNISGQTQDDLLTIPDRGSRRSTRQSTSESTMSSSEGGHYTLARRHSTPHSGYVASQSDVGMDGYNVEGPDRRLTQGSDMSDYMISAADFPIPPPPLTTRIHGAQSSTRILRRVSAAPSVGTLYSPRLYSVSENPFATNTEVNSFDATAAAALDSKSSEEGTTTHHTDDGRRLSAPTAIGGVAERVAIRTSLARRSLLRQSVLRNPFDDEHAPEASQSDRRA